MRLKSTTRDHILFFLLGDFYEMFFNDATLASKELELTLTGRGLRRGGARSPCAAYPITARESYIARLVKKGYFQVAICEQMENPCRGQGMVRREVVRVVTPGTVVENSMLNEEANNHLASIYVRAPAAESPFCDVPPAICRSPRWTPSLRWQLINELRKFQPSEILFNDELLDLEEVTRFIKEKLKASINIVDQDAFDHMDPSWFPATSAPR